MEIQSIPSKQATFTMWTKKIKLCILNMNRLFLLTVIVPTLGSVIYFGFIASDIYISESRFTVRSPKQEQSVSGLGSMLQSAGMSHASDDNNNVASFIMSRDALKQLNAKLPLYQLFGNAHLDLFVRFAGLEREKSFEALYRYYPRRVEIETDSTSNILTLKTSAFTADESIRINETILQLAENKVNKLSERGRQDMIGFASAELERSEAKAKEANLALSTFRNQQAVFNPEKQSGLQLQLISKIQDELISTKTQLDQVRTFTPSNPQIPALQKRVVTLQAEIDIQMSKVASDGNSLSQKSIEFERLDLDRIYASKQLSTALASLELARNEALRKQLYIERIAEPNLPDIAIEPKRLRNIFITFLVGMVLWGIFSMLAAGIREHKD